MGDGQGTDGGERSRLRRALRRRRVLGAVTVVALAAITGVIVYASGSGDDGDRASRDPLDDTGREGYVAAFEAGDGTEADPRVGDNADSVAEQERCLAEAVVDGVGVDVLQDVGTPRDLVEADGGPAAALANADVEVGKQQRDLVYAAAQECTDLRDQFVAGMEQGAVELPPAVVECMKEHLDDGLLQEIVLTELIEGDAAFVDKPELSATLTAIGRECAAT